MRLSTCSLLVVILSTPVVAATWSRADELPKVLFFANPGRSDNDIIRRTKPDVLSPAERHFVEMTKGIFAVTTTQDAIEIGRAKLKNYDALVFFAAINPPVDKQALIEWVKGGGAFVGIHSTANTFVRHAAFVDMLGARFRVRPWHSRKLPQVKARVLVKDAEHPAAKPYAELREVNDDIYLFRDFDVDKIHVVLRLDPESLDMTKMKHKDTEMPIAWTKSFGTGRVFYTALGDAEHVWKDARYRKHLIEGVRWTIRQAD